MDFARSISPGHEDHQQQQQLQQLQHQEEQNEEGAIEANDLVLFGDTEPNLTTNSSLNVKPNINVEDIAVFADIFNTSPNESSINFGEPNYTSTPIQNMGVGVDDKEQEDRQSLSERSAALDADAALQLSIALIEKGQLNFRAANEEHGERQSLDKNSAAVAELQLSILLTEDEQRQLNICANEEKGQHQLQDAKVVNIEEEQRQLKLAENLKKLESRGKKVVIDNDIELIYDPEQECFPIRDDPVYQTKANDALCGNIPFKENVSFFLLL